MKKKILLVTGSSGLVGSESVSFLYKDYDLVYGIDNNQRKIFFGKNGDISARQKEVIKNVKNYLPYMFNSNELLFRMYSRKWLELYFYLKL